MRIKFISVFFLLIIQFSITFVPTFASTPTPDLKDQVKVIVSSAALRSGPGFSYSSVRYVYKGDVLPVFGINEDSSWYMVDIANQLWIASKQVIPEYGTLSSQVTQNIIATTQKTPSKDMRGINNGSIDSDVQVADSKKLPFLDYLDNLELPNWINLKGINWSDWLNREYFRQLFDELPVWAKTGLFIWIISLGLMLLTFRFRWFFGAIIFGLFLGPVGWVIDIYIVIRILATQEYMDNYSPRELWDDILGSWPIMAISGIIFLALTAVSILGGIIVFAYLLAFVGIIKVFLPGPRNNRESSHTYLPYSSSSNDDSSNTSSDDERERAYSDLIYGHDDDDDDNGKGGSLLDGWLIKW